MLETREVPAQFFVWRDGATTGNTAAQVTGFLHLNSAYPALPNDRILVDAATPVEAVRKGFFGRLGVRYQTFKTFYDFGMDTSSTNVADHKPYLIAYGGSASGGSGEIKLEDLAGAGPNQPEQPDWDYNDEVWSFVVIDANFPAPPPQPGEVNVSPPYVDEPKLEVLDPNNAGLTDLKVGKWENAFTAT